MQGEIFLSILFAILVSFFIFHLFLHCSPVSSAFIFSSFSICFLIFHLVHHVPPVSYMSICFLILYLFYHIPSFSPFSICFFILHRFLHFPSVSTEFPSGLKLPLFVLQKLREPINNSVRIRKRTKYFSANQNFFCVNQEMHNIYPRN